jgi:hypothetical protein
MAPVGDVVSVGISIYKGDYGTAAVSAVALLPGLDLLKGRNVAEGAPGVLRATGSHGIALGGNWQGSLEALNPGDDLVYVLRDLDNGELLKVGKSTVEKAGGRFGPYARAGARTGRNLGLDVLTFKAESFTAEAIEAEIRSTLESQGHRLPWDNTAARLGRPGPGVPGASIPARLRSTVQWNYTLETLVPRNWNFGG